MYIDTVPNRNSPPAILLRESYRDNGKVKKRTLANLTKLPAEIIGLIRQALAGPVQVVGESLCGAVFGVLFVLNELARQCGVQRALGHSRLASLTLFLVLARIAHQGERGRVLHQGERGRRANGVASCIPTHIAGDRGCVLHSDTQGRGTALALLRCP